MHNPFGKNKDDQAASESLILYRLIEKPIIHEAIKLLGLCGGEFELKDFKITLNQLHKELHFETYRDFIETMVGAKDNLSLSEVDIATLSDEVATSIRKLHGSLEAYESFKDLMDRAKVYLGNPVKSSSPLEDEEMTFMHLPDGVWQTIADLVF